MPAKIANSIKAVSELRLFGMDFLGVPDVIDVYYAIGSLGSKIESIKNEMTDVIKYYCAIFSLGGELFLDITYISQKYNDFLTNEISLVDFKESGQNFAI